MTNNRRTKSIFKILASQLAVAAFVTIFSLSILFYAEGYRFNYKNFKISKIGVIAVTSFPKEATVKINNRVKAQKTPYSQNLSPDYYNLELSKTGYVTWNRTVLVQSEFVNNFKNVVLFKEKPETNKLTDQRIINQLNSPIDTLALKNNDSLYYSDYEIWVSGNLVTRFSEPITRVIWYSDKQHIIYQQGEEIRVIELTGTNDTPLAILSNTTPTSFIINDKGDQLYYRDGSQYKVSNIR
ncbi:MAG: PEGA domain-containing protein [Patescibacteria group bacterium]|nr:PEGA domain-containing protein [Patescibacteria group bacterium]